MTIEATGAPVATVEVRIGPQFLNLFSEHLYSSPNKAFEELVSNSWDAGARHVFIDIPPDLKAPEAAIWVLDDGSSMDIEGFGALWAVATSAKRAFPTSNGRHPIGKFGVGKLATYLLANELTYVCKAADGHIRAVTMDYRRIDDQEKGKLHIEPLPLEVRNIEEGQLPDLLSNVPDAQAILDRISSGLSVTDETGLGFEDEFGGSDPEPHPEQGTWTLVVLSALKDQGRRLSSGWVRRLLRTSLPLGKSISIYLNDELLTSAKTSVDVADEWVLGPGLNLGQVSLPNGEIIKVEERSSPFPHLFLEDIGIVTGRVRLYADAISGGKSDAVEISNGFFVNIRGRVLKPEDPYFGLSNLSHSVWARFRATIRADDLDEKLSVNREAISDGHELSIFRALLMRLFNRARTTYDSSTAESWPKAGEILTEKWGGVPFEPLKRVVSESFSNAASAPGFIRLPRENDLSAAEANWRTATLASSGEMITDVTLQDLGSTAKLAYYDLESRTVVVNRSHPFALEHQETGQQLRVLRDTALVELLTEAFMADIGLATDQLSEISDYRDRAFRLVAQVRRRSAAQIAALLVEATNHAKGFERIIGDALEYIGFSVERRGQSGEPEGIATAVVSRADGDTKVAYTFTYDAKSAEKGRVKTHNVGIAGLHRHREANNADHTLVVAPTFEEGALEAECRAHGVTPIEAADLARLVMMTVGFGPQSLVGLRGLFDNHSPAATKAWIDRAIELQKQNRALPLGIIIQSLQAITDRAPDRPDMITTSQIAEQCRSLLGNKDWPTRTTVGEALRGLALMAPNVIQVSGQDVILSAPPSKLAQLIGAQINTIPEAYRYGIARGVA